MEKKKSSSCSGIKNWVPFRVTDASANTRALSELIHTDDYLLEFRSNLSAIKKVPSNDGTMN